MKKLKSNNGWRLIITIVSIFSLIFGVSEITSWHLKKYGKYTIGYTIKINKIRGNSVDVTYYYHVNNKIYHGANTFINNTKVPGRYFVKFNKYFPLISCLMQEVPVDSSIVQAPKNGWESLP
ncbi:MAG: hypothetical protein IPL24_05825 [Bacteroidetes bacterium]|nr:hypothetical protein [Bacteroidota bacterium]MBK8363208.1 hypothetical protein [Bacteroidota bacterium]